MKWPYLTEPEQKFSAKFKSSPQHFIVEEIPAYLPAGEGEHLYIWLEKTNLTTDQVIFRLSQALGMKTKNIGYAGKKDRVGVTRQWLSLWRIKKEQIVDVQIPGVTVLQMDYHKNKLRPGHLQGNRFSIFLAEADAAAPGIARHLFAKLETTGVANYFGPQRFGIKGDNQLIGMAILQSDWQRVFRLVLGNPDEVEKSVQILQARILYEKGQLTEALNLWPKEQFIPRNLLRRLIETNGDIAKTARRFSGKQLIFYLHALQSFWFNRCLAQRIREINRIWPGDLAYLHKNGAVFRVADAEVEQERADRFEISPSGPILGRKMIEPEEKELQLEAKVFSDGRPDFSGLKSKFTRRNLDGGRRPYRVPFQNAVVEYDNNRLLLKFDLPAGCYATSVIRELLKENFPEPDYQIPDFTAGN
ncbi:MAG TPA: tRNA pseudouridine(13) synthase TruD [Bacteroidetes bacterium]|nr:tRNA pseudouridine(13) synthase TruD [Bacteroidota bacterium]